MTGKYFTTPIFYVNDKPHIGHAYTMLVADLLSRYNRFLGKEVFFLTGTDEHGLKIQQSAEKQSIKPIELATKYSNYFRELWGSLNYTNDDFIRTTEERHIKVVKYVLQYLYDKGDIYKGEYEGFYCIPCEIFLTEKDLKNGNCPHCNREITQFKESNYFFRMSKYSEWLKSYIKENNFIRPSFRANETLGFIGDGLNDLCISRSKSRLSWGIDLPFDDQYVTYVWFDALINYISALGYPDGELFKKFWPASVHVIGKDILTTHTVYWTTMLKALDLSIPEKIYAHGWWLVDNNKMSKSIGNVVDPLKISEDYGVDAFRYYLAAEMTPGYDTSFSLESFIQRYNADLANDLGNTVSRLLAMVHKYRNGVLKKPCGSEADKAFVELFINEISPIVEYVEEISFDKITKTTGKLVYYISKYINDNEPWFLSKSNKGEDGYERLDDILYNSTEALRIVTGLLYPIMPGKVFEIRGAINYKDDLDSFDRVIVWNTLPDQHMVNNSILAFPKIEVN